MIPFFVFYKMLASTKLTTLLRNYCGLCANLYFKYGDMVLKIHTHDRTDLCIICYTEDFMYVWVNDDGYKQSQNGSRYVSHLKTSEIEMILTCFEQFIQESEERIYVALNGATSTFNKLLKQK